MRVRGRTRKLGKKKEFSGRRKEEERVTGDLKRKGVAHYEGSGLEPS